MSTCVAVDPIPGRERLLGGYWNDEDYWVPDRTVTVAGPVWTVLQGVPCPECRYHPKWLGCPTCPTCNGSGVAAPVLGDEQYLFEPGVIQWKATQHTVLPVTDDYEALAGVYEGPAAVEITPGGILQWWPEWGGAVDEDEVIDITAEVAHLDLRPGMYVVRFDGLEAVDPPITEMACSFPVNPGMGNAFEARCETYTPEGVAVLGGPCDGCDRSGRVPLSVQSGIVNRIELP